MMRLAQQACSWLSLRHRLTLLQFSVSAFGDVSKYTGGCAACLRSHQSSSPTQLLTYPTFL